MKGEKFDRTMVMTLAFFLSNGSLPVVQRPIQTCGLVPREPTRRGSCVRRVSRSWVVRDSNDAWARGPRVSCVGFYRIVALHHRGISSDAEVWGDNTLNV